MAGPFEAVVKATIKELDRGEWGYREEVSEAFRRTPTGSWAAPAGWAGKGGPMDGTVINPWYGLFPPEWADGLCSGEGDGHRSGELWERRRRALQRLGDCCILYAGCQCADMWSMACLLWTAPNRVAQAADRSKRGRAWALGKRGSQPPGNRPGETGAGDARIQNGVGEQAANGVREVVA